MDKDIAINLIFGVKGGTPVVTCDCGRSYYESNGEFMDDGEFDEYENDEKYIPCVSPTFIQTHLLGTRVFGCACNWESKLIAFLDTEVEGIKDYYEARSKELQSKSELFEKASIKNG